MTALRFTAILFLFAICSYAMLANEASAQVKSLTLIFLDDTGKPIPKTKLAYAGDPKPHKDPDHRFYTEADENGRYVIEFNPDKPQRELNIRIEAPGHTFFHAGWGGDSGSIETDPIPAEYIVKLEKAATVGGIILDENGKPLAGVSVYFGIPWGKRARVEQKTFGMHGCEAKTDENGIWKYESLPLDQLNSGTILNLSHPDYTRTTKEINRLSDLAPNAEGKFTQSVQMEQGITVKGQVTDTEGKPVAGAVVIGRHEEWGEKKTETNENGEYTFTNWAESKSAYIGVWKSGMMATLKSFPVNKENLLVVDVTMKPAGKPVTVKIVNKAGEPIKGFEVALARWGEHRYPSVMLDGKSGPAYLVENDKPKTDENGRWTWKEAPDEEVVLVMTFRDRYMGIADKSVIPRDEEYVFVTADPLKISGKVTDAQSGEIIPRFTLFFGTPIGNSNDLWWHNNGTKTDGAYSVNTTDPSDTTIGVKIEAAGYESAVFRNTSQTEGNITHNFALKKLSPERAKGIYGIVLQPDGKPAENVAVAMATHGGGGWLRIENGRLDGLQEPYSIPTNKEGQFNFKYIDFEAEARDRFYGYPDETRVDYILFFLHDTGFKRLKQQDWEALDDNKSITLEPWGRIEGTLKIGTQPGKGLPVQSQISFDNEHFIGQEGEPRGFMDHEAITDESGKFSFDRVPAGFVFVARTTKYIDAKGNWRGSHPSHSAGSIKLKPGETATVTLGGIGRPVIGKLVPVKELEIQTHWAFAEVECCMTLEDLDSHPAMIAVEELRKKMVPKEILEETDMAKLQELYQAWSETEDGKKFSALAEETFKPVMAMQERNRVKRAKKLSCVVAPDGTFRLDDVPAGDWTLKVTLDAPPPEDRCAWGDKIGLLEYEFAVAIVPGGVSDEPLDIGSLEIKQLAQQNQFPKVGEAAYEFELVKIEPIAADGTFEDKGILRFSDFKGKYVILDFWATWCGPCLAKLPELKTLYGKIKDDDRFVMIGISLDNAGSEEMLGKFVLRREMPWLHGLSGDWQSNTARTYGIQSIPALLLIGPDGKVLLSNPELEELTKKVEELRR